ncbi:MAG: mannosyltransferase [Planctomycetota bacterium]
MVYKSLLTCQRGPVGSPYSRPYVDNPDDNPWSNWTPQRRLVAGLLVTIVLGCLARFMALGSWSLWLDESLTLADSYHSQDMNNPVGYALMGWFYQLGGERPGEYLMRVPAAVMGVVSILLTIWCFWPVVGRYASLGAGALLAVSSWHIYWSQNARFYTLAMALSLLGSGMVLRAILGVGKRRLWMGLIVLGLAPVVHPSAAILLGSLILALWIGRWTGAFAAFPPQPAVWRVLSFAVLLGVFLGSGWSFQVLVDWKERQGEGTPLHLLLSSGYNITPAIALGALVGTWVALKRLKGPTVIPVYVCLLLSAVAVGLSFFVRVSAQYIFVLLPWICLLAALPLVLLEKAEHEADGVPLPTRKTALCAIYLAVLALPSLVDSSLYFSVRHGDRPRWREAYRHVFENQARGDLILGMDAPVGEYYLDPRGTDLRAWRRVGWLDSYRTRLADRWSRYPRRTWFVIQPELLADWSAEDRDDFLELLKAECELQAEFPIPYTPRSLGVEVWLRP